MVIRKPPYFVFPDIPAFEEISFEKLTGKNVLQFHKLFEADDNIFTDERFKDYEKAKLYTRFIEESSVFSSKHGGQDWLFLWNGEYAGVLHLYDLSLEEFAENNKRCQIGFATTPKMRNKGITKKALCYFLKYIFENYSFIKYIHSSALKENVASQALQTSVGFKIDPEERLSSKHIFYIMERK